MTRTYECMFLVDNDAVRAGWQSAKAAVAAVLAKNKGKVLTARRWDERRLAYPINHKNRATFLLSYCELESEGIESLRRDLDLSESVLRYLILQAESVPAEEVELSKAEESDDFVVPEPPEDNALDLAPETGEAEADEAKAPGEAKEGEKPREKDAAEKAVPEEKAEQAEETEKQEEPAAASETTTTATKEG